MSFDFNLHNFPDPPDPNDPKNGQHNQHDHGPGGDSSFKSSEFSTFTRNTPRNAVENFFSIPSLDTPDLAELFGVIKALYQPTYNQPLIQKYISKLAEDRTLYELLCNIFVMPYLNEFSKIIGWADENIFIWMYEDTESEDPAEIDSYKQKVKAAYSKLDDLGINTLINDPYTNEIDRDNLYSYIEALKNGISIHGRIVAPVGDSGTEDPWWTAPSEIPNNSIESIHNDLQTVCNELNRLITDQEPIVGLVHSKMEFSLKTVFNALSSLLEILQPSKISEEPDVSEKNASDFMRLCRPVHSAAMFYGSQLSISSASILDSCATGSDLDSEDDTLDLDDNQEDDNTDYIMAIVNEANFESLSTQEKRIRLQAGCDTVDALIALFVTIYGHIGLNVNPDNN